MADAWHPVPERGLRRARASCVEHVTVRRDRGEGAAVEAVEVVGDDVEVVEVVTYFLGGIRRRRRRRRVFREREEVPRARRPLRERVRRVRPPPERGRFGEGRGVFQPRRGVGDGEGLGADEGAELARRPRERRRRRRIGGGGGGDARRREEDVVEEDGVPRGGGGRRGRGEHRRRALPRHGSRQSFSAEVRLSQGHVPAAQRRGAVLRGRRRRGGGRRRHGAARAQPRSAREGRRRAQ